MNATVRLNIPRQVPLQCPHCHAHGWVTLVASRNPAAVTLDWRCTNCGHDWPAVQTIADEDRRSDPEIP